MNLRIKSLIHASGDTEIYDLDVIKDIEQLLGKYSFLKPIMYSSPNLEDVARNLVDALSSHHLDAWLSE